jgi:hypothetical protein
MSRDSYRLRTGWALALLLALLVVSQPSSAADLTQPPAIMREVGETGPVDSRKLILPYIFATETLDVAGGAAFGASAWPQEQSSLFSALLGTTNESWGLFFVGTSLKVAGTQRLFIDTSASLGRYTDLRSYIDGNPEYPDSRAGSNDSDPNDFISGEGNHNWLLLNFKYVLPIGHARQSAIANYVLDRGILVSGATGAESWNPLRSGRTLLQLEPFVIERTYDVPDDVPGGRSNGLAISVLHDNRDFSPNPSRGTTTTLRLVRDFGKFGSTTSWTTVDGKFSKYFYLGSTRHARQQVLAFNVWTADSPTWEEWETDEGTVYDHRPPPYLGTTLGGYLRMRGFPQYRFSDKAAVYYGLEYRVIPEWNPLGSISWLRWLRIDWWQWVPFAEAGRVADHWNLSELHSDMKWDVGLGLRLMTAKVVVRADSAVSEEGFHIWAMVGQAF